MLGRRSSLILLSKGRTVLGDRSWVCIPGIALMVISQNYRLAEVGRDLWRETAPTLLLKQGHLEPVDQDYVQMGF